jgi:hypothetical protein
MKILKFFVENLKMRVLAFDFEPTAEKLSETLFQVLKGRLLDVGVFIDYVTVFENENSKATYIEE